MSTEQEQDQEGQEPRAERPRAQRATVGLIGRYRRGSGVAREVWITDLSQDGCRFYDRFGTMTPGTTITLRLGTFGPIPAVVRWWENHTNGVQFIEPLHVSVFEHVCKQLSDEPPLRLDMSRL